MPTIDKQTGTASLTQFGNPTLVHSLKLKRGMVMQDFVLNSNGRYFVSQADNGSNGQREPYENTLITRINPLTQNQDSMMLVDASHGIGLDVVYEKGVPYILFNWRAPNPQGVWWQSVKFRYKPDTKPYTRERLVKECGLVAFPPIDNPELLNHYDWKRDWVVSKHFDNAGTDIYARRKISEFWSGVDKKYGEIPAPISKGTLQGFTTINNTLYRLMGQGVYQNVQPANDPIAIQSFDWTTGKELVYKIYPTLGQIKKNQWPDGKCEPEGLAVMRDKSGKASLLVGLVVGMGKNRRWKIYKFKDIGAA